MATRIQPLRVGEICVDQTRRVMSTPILYRHQLNRLGAVKMPDVADPTMPCWGMASARSAGTRPGKTYASGERDHNNDHNNHNKSQQHSLSFSPFPCCDVVLL